MTSTTNLIRECRDVFGTKRMVWEMGGGVAALVAFMAIAFGAALSSASPMEPASPSPPFGLQSTIAGER